MALVGLAVHSEVSRRRQTVLLLVGIAGAALFYGDGMITPAISVLSAVEGLQVAAPVLKLYVVPITIAVLIGFFAVQSRGSERIGAYFGPIMAVWFIVLAISGLLQIVREPVVLAALKPVHAVGFLVSHDLIGLLALGSVILALTGADALYADMGHFGHAPSGSIGLFLFYGANFKLLRSGRVCALPPRGLRQPLLSVISGGGFSLLLAASCPDLGST